MAFCAICGQDHEPGVPCGSQWVHEDKIDHKSYAEVKRAADRFMIKLGVGLLFLVVLTIVLLVVLHSSGH